MNCKRISSYITLMVIGFILVLLALCAFGETQLQLDRKFLNALHQTESSGRAGPIFGDNGLAIGPFQIHKSYWKDSGVKGSYLDCQGYAYSVKVVTAYMNKYAREAIQQKNYERLARVHNGGPQGYRYACTLDYWNRFKTFLVDNSTNSQYRVVR